MPLPLAILIFEILAVVATALTVSEILGLMEELFEDYKKFSGGVQKAQEELHRVMDQIKKEIAQGIDEKEELAFLEAESTLDPQSEATKKAEAGSPIINAAIQQKIPFRRVISAVCDQAEKLPIPSLRKKKGMTLKDLPASKKKALEELLRLTTGELAEKTYEELIVVRLRQLATSLIFEFVDSCLDWKSPLKAKVSFGPPPGYEAHPLGEGGATRLDRSGGKVNPFYPGPFQYRRGSIAADLVIPEYRAQRCDKHNIFAIIEIKFEGGPNDAKQLGQYIRLIDSAAKQRL